jgi:hypothetical protein
MSIRTQDAAEHDVVTVCSLSSGLAFRAPRTCAQLCTTPLFPHASVNCDDALRVQVTAAVSAVLVSVALANSSPAAQAPCTSTPANQNAALKALYDSTNGPNWAVVSSDGSPWTAGDACATRFRGVYCAGRPGTSVCDVVYVLTLQS